MIVSTHPATELKWWNKAFPRLVALNNDPSKVFLALDKLPAGKVRLLELRLLSSSYPPKDVETYNQEEFHEYAGTISLKNE